MKTLDKGFLNFGLSVLTAVILLLAIGCTENQRAKLYGGTAKVNLIKGHKLVNVTWKDTDLWYLTKPMGPNDVAETYTFLQESNFGLVEGKVIIIETK